MRILIASLGLLVPGFLAQPAAAQEYPWCAIYDQGGEVKNCGFTTREQCLWTISGAGGYCAENRFYVAPRSAPEPQQPPQQPRTRDQRPAR